jgi:hypothetical protein
VAAEVAPSAVDVLPAAHAVCAALPTPHQLPAVHWEQVDELVAPVAPEKVPAAQVEGAETPAAQYEPAGQDVIDEPPVQNEPDEGMERKQTRGGTNQLINARRCNVQVRSRE